MFSRVGHFLLIVALIGAAGGHWAALQSVAWATMLADNARVAPLSEALGKTFDGKHPCALCKQIAKGQAGEKKSDAQVQIKKLEFLRQSAALVPACPAHFIMSRNTAASWPLLAEVPSVPPPRILPA